MQKFTFLFILFGFLFTLQPVYAFNCTIRSNSCNAGETCMFSLVKTTNSHAGNCDQYTNKVCCSNISSTSIKSSCSSDEGGIISLFATSNAHVERYGQGNYNNHVCAKFASSELNCSLKDSCNSTEVCVVSLNANTNSHAGACTSYSNKICCAQLSDLEVNQSSINENNTSPLYNQSVLFNITVWNIGDRAAPNVNVSCYYNGIYFDSSAINSIPPDVSMQTPRYTTCAWTALAGTYNISVRVDPANDIKEYNKTNNEAWKLITVSRAPQQLTLQLNGSSTDRTYLLGIHRIAEIKAWSNISILPVTIYSNYTGTLESIASASSGIAINYTDTTTAGPGKYLIRANSTGNENYTSAISDSYIMTVRLPITTITCEAGGPYTPTSLIIVIGNSSDIEGTPLYSSGNISIFKDDVLQDSRAFTSSSDGTISSSFGPLATGNHMANISANSTYCAAAFGVITPKAPCGGQPITLSGTAYDSTTGELISSGTIRITVQETGDETEQSFTSGEWSATLTSCFTSGARYNAAVRITDTSGKVSYSQIQFVAP